MSGGVRVPLPGVDDYWKVVIEMSIAGESGCDSGESLPRYMAGDGEDLAKDLHSRAV